MNINKKLLALLFVAVIGVGTASCNAQNTLPSEVYVNIDVVWRASDKAKEELTKIESIQKAGEDEIKVMNDELKLLVDKFNASKTDTEKKALAPQIEQKRAELIRYTNTKRQEIENIRNEAQQKFIQAVVPIINEYRQEKGYKVIHRFQANQILSIAPELDITKDISDLYNK